VEPPQSLIEAVVDAVVEATALYDAEDYARAAAVLAAALPALAEAVNHADPDLVRAAQLYAMVLSHSDHRTRLEEARGWADYAHAASWVMRGPDDGLTELTLMTLAHVLRRCGDFTQSVRLYRQLIDGLVARCGGCSPQVLLVRADRAATLHDAGQCTAAHHEMTEVLASYRRHHPVHDRTEIHLIRRLAEMQRVCGLDRAAASNLFEALRLAHDHLPAGDRISDTIRRSARAPYPRPHPCEFRDSPPGQHQS
jgi:hypothetical protein